MSRRLGDLGDRMKAYERAHEAVLPPRQPVIFRVDGKAFHTLTRGSEKPFDAHVAACMDAAALALCEGIQGARLGYVQSDEISVLVYYHERHQSQPWLDGRVQKSVGVAASIAAVAFDRSWGTGGAVAFDARAFVVPPDDVCNYFLWRQRDAERNSIQGLAQSLASQQQLHGLNTAALQELCFSRGHNWDALPAYWKRGRCVVREAYEHEGTERWRWTIDREPPRFSQDRGYVEGRMPTPGSTHDE